MRNFLRDYWPSLLVICFIIYATLANDPLGADELPAIPYLDKLIHAVMMGGLVGALAFDITRSKPKDERKSTLCWTLMWKIFFAVCIFSAIDEIAQATITMKRGAEWLDYCADCVGGIVAVFTAPPAIRKCLKID